MHRRKQADLQWKWGGVLPEGQTLNTPGSSGTFMGDGGLTGFFEEYLYKDSLFCERGALQSGYIPNKIGHREKEIQQIAQTLAPSIRSERPSNLFIYGKTGTGKTLAVKHVTSRLREVATQRGVPLHPIYVNCKLKRAADTEYRLVAQLIRSFGGTVAATGLPTDEVYRAFFKVVDGEKRAVIIVLDEIDELVRRAGDEVLYTLLRMNEELKRAHISLVGISNDLIFIDTIDPRVKSSLSEEEIIFPPYNALQLQDILRARSEIAFSPGKLDDGVIEKCSAYAAREHGDARRALELLRVAGELAERENQQVVGVTHIDGAEEKIERDRVIDIVGSQPKQSQAALLALLSLNEKKKESISTGEVYATYKPISTQAGLRPLTQRRIADILAELDMLGIINTRVVSKGRYGRTREVSLLVPSPLFRPTKKILEEGLAIS